jgi:hypothetical protein
MTMSYLNISIEPADIPGQYTAEPSEDYADDAEEIIDNMMAAGVKLFELGLDNLAAELDIRWAIDIPPERVFYAIPDDPEGRPFYFGIAAQQ